LFITKDNIKLQKYLYWQKKLKNIPNILASLRIFLAFLMFLFLVDRNSLFFNFAWADYFAALIGNT